MNEFSQKKKNGASIPDDSNETVLHKILEAGIMAPSGDNAQPWKFELSGNEIGVYVDKNADHSSFNINQIASLISCGAVAENMRIAASRQYLNTSMHFPTGKLNSTKTVEEVVRLTLEKGATALCDNLYPFINQRHTNRTQYNKKAIPAEDLQKLKKTIALIDNVHLQLITDEDRKKQIAKLVGQADVIRWENRELHEHLMKMIRITNEEMLKTRDGFHIKNLETMTAITLFRMQYQYGQKNTFSKEHRQLLEAVWNEYNHLFNVNENETEAHIMLFRLGYGKHVQVKTLRKQMTEFMM